jgi:hypothetical protein
VSETAAKEWAELEARLLAERDPMHAAEVLMRDVLGDAAWEGVPPEVKEILVGNGPALVAEIRGGYPDVTVEQLGTLEQPTLFVGAKDSVFDYRETAEVLAAAVRAVRIEWIEGGHAIDPAHPVVLDFLDEVLSLKEEPSIA